VKTAEQPIKMRCRKAMWFGYGAPAGHCDEPAYGPEKHMRDWPGGWTEAGIARCPNHGGPTVEEFMQWLKMQIEA
jgi:hypothetical protein